MAEVIIQISPQSSELMEIVNKVKCPQCDSIFSNAPNLEMHLIKRHHKISNYLDKKPEDCVFQYFCPESGCKYFLENRRDLNELRFFSKMKYLKQHYLKVHTSKNVVCEKCQKKFVTERAKQVHQKKECGVDFTCIECKKGYNTYLALMTHCKRKSHILYKVLQDSCKKKLINDPKSFIRGRQILPRPTELDPMEAATALSELSWKAVVRRGVDASTQTKGRATRCRTKRTWAATQTDSILPSTNLLSDLVPSQLFSSATQTNADLMFDLSLLPGEYDSSSPQ
uniref:C2H2-type domain-containing protein n=2 Tax=Rhodnius prolixus TaxID=13249 RepID=T1HKP1_RHOPR